MSYDHRHGFVSGLAIGGLFALALLVSLHGASRMVYGDPGALFARPGGSGTLCTQAQPCALETALTQAVAGDTLTLAGGVYTGSGEAVVVLDESISLYGGWDGTTSTPPVRDPGLYPTTLDGENMRRGVTISGGAPTLDGLIVTRGRSSYSGGGIAAENASSTIRNCQIIGNTAPGDGGGVFINRGSAQILHNRILNNRANWAGGLRIINNADVSLIGNEIRNNVAQATGGGVYVDCCGDTAPLIAQNLIVDNDGRHAGGGVRVESTNARLVNNIVARNRATIGAGVWLGGAASYPVDATLTHNTLVASSTGGEGIWVDAHVTATLVNDLLTDYTIGITNTAPASSTLSVDHSLFWNADDPIVGTNAVRADPLLDATDHLTAGSPARDAGTAVDVTTDVDGDPRPVGAYDIGADEYALRRFLPVLVRNHTDVARFWLTSMRSCDKMR
jgi:hypothetical protein